MVLKWTFGVQNLAGSWGVRGSWTFLKLLTIIAGLTTPVLVPHSLSYVGYGRDKQGHIVLCEEVTPLEFYEYV